MGRVLLAWELGEGYGHLAPLRAMAIGLRAAGHVPAFAVRHLTNAAEILGHDLGDVWQTPMPDRVLSNPVKTQVSYASLLHNTGFGDPAGLAARVGSWRAMMRAHRADLVVCQHAPTAALAARTLDVPFFYIGTGFVVPPLRTPFPSFRVDGHVPESVLVQNDAHVLGSVNQALAILGLDPLETLQDIYRGGRPWVLSYDALDHYGSNRPEPCIGLPRESHGPAVAWPDGDGPKVFAYLRPVPTLTQLLEGLRDCRARVLLRASAIPPATFSPYLRPGLTVVDGVIDFVAAAAECDAFVNYAPHSTVAECLLAGKPGVVVPDNQERVLVATRMVGVGAGIALAQSAAGSLGPALEKVLDDPSYTANAARFADSVRHIDRDQIFPRLVEEAERVLN